jgi:hypothetical protein
VSAGADAGVIQRALDDAGRLRGQRPVVHLPVGRYKISRTLIIPTESDVQLVGDSAGETGSRLDWTGPAGGLLLKLQGPARATLRDLFLGASNARAILVENADQPRGEIFADQLNVSGPAQLPKNDGRHPEDIPIALLVNGLVHTDVLFRCLQGSGNAGCWVEVNGRPVSGQTDNQVSIFNGASSSSEGQYCVHNGGHLVVRGVYHEKNTGSLRGLRLSDSGSLVVDATRFSYRTATNSPLVGVKDFHGLLTIATSELLPVDSTNTCRFEITGNGADTSALALNDLFWVYEPGVSADKVLLNQAIPAAHGGLIGCNMNSPRQGLFKTGGFAFLDNFTLGAEFSPRTTPSAGQNTNNLPDTEMLADLAPLREARVWLPGNTPAEETELCFYRVMAQGDIPPVVEFTSEMPER